MKCSEKNEDLAKFLIDVVEDPNVYQLKEKLKQKVEEIDLKVTKWSENTLLTYEKLVAAKHSFTSFDEEAQFALKCFYTTYKFN